LKIFAGRKCLKCRNPFRHFRHRHMVRISKLFGVTMNWLQRLKEIPQEAPPIIPPVPGKRGMLQSHAECLPPRDTGAHTTTAAPPDQSESTASTAPHTANITRAGITYGATPHCYSCKCTDLWQARYRVTVCRRCHPPASGAELIPEKLSAATSQDVMLRRRPL
jgi:hypothetical protein